MQFDIVISSCKKDQFVLQKDYEIEINIDYTIKDISSF